MATKAQLLLLARARKRKAEAEGTATPMPAGHADAPEAFAAASADSQKLQGGPGVEPEQDLISQIMGVADYADNTGAITADGFTRGAAALLGAPVDLINQAPVLANMIPGVEGVRPFSEKPFGGSQSINEALHLGGAIPGAPDPQDALQSILQRVGFEVGASAIPVGGALTAAARVGKEGAKRIPGLAGMFVEPAAVAPAHFVGKELAAATAAGTGAGAANEFVGADQFDDNFWSDFVGSLAGLGTYSVGKAVLGAGGNLVSAATGSPKFLDDVAGREVADRIINNSTRMADTAARAGGQIDTQSLASQLRRPAPVEEAVPGYQANIGDRSMDPGLQTFAFNQDAVSPGASNARRVSNETAVNDRIASFDPGGDPAQFRADLEAARDARIAGAETAAADAGGEFERLIQSLSPSSPYAEDRGAAVRGGLANAERAASEVERDVWGDIHGTVDPAPLATRFEEATSGLPLARRQIVADLEAALGIPAGFEGPVDIQEITALRSRLTTDQRNARRGPQPDENRANVIGRYLDELETFMTSDAVPVETQQRVDLARGVTRDVNERFNRPNDPLSAVLSTKEGRPDIPDSSAARRFVQPDSAQASNIDRLLAETDLTSQAVSTRRAIKDEILSDIQERGLLGRPDQLEEHLNSFSRVFDRFPDLREELTQAAGVGRSAAATRRSADELRRDLTTPGRSAMANYLKFADESAAEAIRTVTSSPRPREAARELLDAAGGSADARRNARSALWMEVQRRGWLQAPGMTGETRWSGKRLRDVFAEPKVNAVAQELWADNPSDLESIRQVFEALAQAEGSTRARAVGSSGTSQSLSGKFDPSLSAASIASRARSVTRGVLSPTVAAVDVIATWLRGRAAQVQSRAIDTIASAVVNNPDLAADLLEKYNPADYAARRRLVTQKYGVRATQLLNLLDEAHAESEGQDPLVNAILRESPADARPDVSDESLVRVVMENKGDHRG